MDNSWISSEKSSKQFGNSVCIKQKVLKSYVKNIMTRQNFTPVFNLQLWTEISDTQPYIFLMEQNKILNHALTHEEFFNNYFSRFYNNHLHLSHWYILASQKHNVMRKYIFSELLKKSPKDYKQQLKQNLIKKRRNGKKKQKNNKVELSKFYMRSTPESPTKGTFKNGNQLEKTIQKNEEYKNNSKMIELKNQNKLDQKYNQDYHQLFVKTLDACEGSKYIYYDFTKHQKGYQNKYKYNQFIRIKRKQPFLNPLVRSQISLHNSSKNTILQPSENFYRCQKKLNHTTALVERKSSEHFNIRQAFKQDYSFQKQKKQHRHNFSAFEIISIGSCHEKQKKNKNPKSFKKEVLLKKIPYKLGKQKIGGKTTSSLFHSASLKSKILR